MQTKFLFCCFLCVCVFGLMCIIEGREMGGKKCHISFQLWIHVHSYMFLCHTIWEIYMCLLCEWVKYCLNISMENGAKYHRNFPPSLILTTSNNKRASLLLCSYIYLYDLLKFVKYRWQMKFINLILIKFLCLLQCSTFNWHFLVSFILESVHFCSICI